MDTRSPMERNGINTDDLMKCEKTELIEVISELDHLVKELLTILNYYTVCGKENRETMEKIKRLELMKRYMRRKCNDR